MKLNYCPECGEKLLLKANNNESQLFCPKCNSYRFAIYYSVVLVAIFNQEKTKVCLLKQKYINNDYMVLLSGYIDKGETSEHAVIREVKEELGIELKSSQYIKSMVHEKSGNLMNCFIGTADEKQPITLQKNEVDEAKWVDKRLAISLLRKDSLGYNFFTSI